MILLKEGLDEQGDCFTRECLERMDGHSARITINEKFDSTKPLGVSVGLNTREEEGKLILEAECELEPEGAQMVADGAELAFGGEIQKESCAEGADCGRTFSRVAPTEFALTFKKVRQ